MMLDYKLLEALSAVVSQGGFENAARHLHITQSAVSQRIRQLEETVGRPLLVRTTPPLATADGRTLLAHFLKVQILESDLTTALEGEDKGYTRLSVAVNRDTLTLWFMEAVADFLKSERCTLEILAEDQDITHEFLRNGRVFGCVGGRKQALQGCKVDYLGRMTFHCVATPAFAHTWFQKGVNKENLLKAPGVIFDKNDHMLENYLETHFKIRLQKPPLHVVPSVSEYARFITTGYGYGLLALSQVEKPLARGELVDLAPKKVTHVDLYWHTWQLQSEIAAGFSKAITTNAKRLIR